MDAATEQPVMTLADFHETPEFKILTPAMQVFFDTYAATLDATQAVRAAYPRAKKDAKYANVLIYKLAASPRMRAANAKFYGLSHRDQYLAELDSQIRRAKAGERAALLAIKAKVFLDIDVAVPAAAPEPAGEATEYRYPIGKTIMQDNKKYVVTAVEVK